MALDAGMRSASYPCQSTPEKEPPMPNEQEATWDPVLVWLMKKETISSP